MENPAGWTPAERSIEDALREHEESTARGSMGISLVKRIYLKLVDEGHIVTEEKS